MQEPMERTFGQKAVRIDFNTAGSSQVDKAKTAYANLMDDVHTHPQPLNDSYENETDRLRFRTLQLLEQACEAHVKMLTVGL